MSENCSKTPNPVETDSSSNKVEVIDDTASLVRKDPFTRKVRDIIDREFPLITQPAENGASVQVRAVNFRTEGLERFAAVRFFDSIIERQLLGQEIGSKRRISLTEAAVGISLLAGVEYKRDSRPGWISPGLYMPADVCIQAGNTTVELYNGIREQDRSTSRGSLIRIYGLIVGGMFGTAELDETFKKVGIHYFDEKETRRATKDHVAKGEIDDSLPEGSAAWFNEFLTFVDEITETPFQKILSDYGYYVKDPYSEKAREAVLRIYEAQTGVDRLDPKIKVYKEALDYTPPDSSKENHKP